MIKPLVSLMGMLCVLSVNAQNDSVRNNIEGKNNDTQPITILKKDTNSFTIINVIQPHTKSSKSEKQLAKINDEKSNDDVKTSIVKAKQNSQHWFDALYVNLICAGINKFVKKD